MKFAEYLSENFHLEADLVQYIEENVQTKVFNKGDYILREGDSCSLTYWVDTGLLTKYHLDDNGKKHIIQFAPENWWVTDGECSVKNGKAKYFIFAEEDTLAVYLKESFIMDLSSKNKDFLVFHNKLLLRHITHLTDRILSMVKDSAAEKYAKFIKQYPNISSRVPQNQVASYLGITPESLSRAKKELS